MVGIIESPADMEIDGRDRPDSLVENLVKSSVNTTDSLLDNSKLFYQKLKEFNEFHGLSLAASVVGKAKALDLYVLYKEVMTRGGFALVTKDGRWAEVASALKFTGRVANPSNQLRDLYESLLYQFELIYCSGTQTKPNAPSEPLLSSSLIKKPTRGHSSNSGDHSTVKRKLPNYPCNWSRDSLDLGSQVGNTFSGVIETEFDSGYLVSAMNGSEKLNGVLYQSKDSMGEQFAIVPSLIEPVRSGKIELAFRSSSQNKAKLGQTAGSSAKYIQKKDPEAPKRIRTAYQMYLHKECDRLKKIHGQNLTQNACKRVIEAWNCLSKSDRMPYIEESRKDKERFEREMVAYSERQKIQVKEVTYNPEPEPNISNFQTEETGNAQSNDENHVSSIIDFQKEETSKAHFNDEYYHVSLQMEESDKLLEPDQSLVEFAVKMMENAGKLDASLQIELGEFLSVP